MTATANNNEPLNDFALPFCQVWNHHDGRVLHCAEMSIKTNGSHSEFLTPIFLAWLIHGGDMIRTTCLSQGATYSLELFEPHRGLLEDSQVVSYGTISNMSLLNIQWHGHDVVTLMREKINFHIQGAPRFLGDESSPNGRPSRWFTQGNCVGRI